MDLGAGQRSDGEIGGAFGRDVDKAVAQSFAGHRIACD